MAKASEIEEVSTSEIIQKVKYIRNTLSLLDLKTRKKKRKKNQK
ncbi:MAG: hypothetical protein ACTSPN_11685 [Promethearchaeota archaeon]